MQHPDGPTADGGAKNRRRLFTSLPQFLSDRGSSLGREDKKEGWECGLERRPIKVNPEIDLFEIRKRERQVASRQILVIPSEYILRDFFRDRSCPPKQQSP